MNYRLFTTIAFTLLTAPAVSNAAAPVVDGKAVDAVRQQETSQQNQLIGELMRQVMQLQKEVSYLRGKSEEQGYQIKKLQRQQKELYTDLDRRLTEATQGGMSVSGEEVGAAGVVQGDSTDSTSDSNLSDAQKAYNKAFSQFSEKKYAFAKSSFKSFVKDYPEHPLSSNAHYILGQLHFNDKEYDKAASEFEAVYAQFPDTSVKDKAMLKLAQTHEIRGDKAAAKKAYQALAEAFPNTTAGKLAKVKLSSL
ncbi:tol-pal system protein YbgF [Kangiella sediminilitoris]|uniref:Cell division coordinator CpoB n=1 Tax=Kangiella sediminilitoris TaxID=1144748 RepID=A0A1B3BBY0_9GAMM|nr:tol-pal system protein YbgF [Kangiella sediminilitoris]AOE50302.1 Tol-pal system protein YbgF [Kangiella sediminilitoris]